MGPLQGIRVIEIAGIGPGQYCGMLLADMGADVVRVVREQADSDLGVSLPEKFNLMNRGRMTVAADLKTEAGVDLVLRLCESADAIIEGFRPGVMERLGLGPNECMDRNPKLVFGRMTGWGQSGPLADTAGHDTNYIALAGALGAIGDADRPPPIPLNLIGDFGGGGVFLAMGMLAAMLEARQSGKGQVVDAAMVDGVASMLTLFHGLMAGGMWTDQRQSNFLDGAAPYTRNYETSDGKFVAVCAIENRFYRALLKGLDLTSVDPGQQNKQSAWAENTELLSERFLSKTRDEWARIFDGTDACVSPVLSLVEATAHPHNRDRETFVTVDGIVQPGPAPRFSRTRSEIRSAPGTAPAASREALREWGLSATEIDEILATDAGPDQGDVQ